MNLLLRPIALLGAAATDSIEFLGGLGYLLRDAAAAAPAGLLQRRARRQGWRNLWAQMVRVGVRSVPIVSLVLFCIGAILSLQMGPILQTYGQVNKVANVIGVATLRELGPLIGAIVLTGFAGASIAAELGTMVVGEEIEALDALAIPPMRFLVLPRVVATTTMMVCVAVVGDVVGVLGGMFVGRVFFGITPRRFLSDALGAVVLHDFVTGLIKAAVFGALISGLACYLGLRVEGGAQGVGVATTRTVVLTIVFLIIVDLMFTAMFYYLGW